jgi:hypothetical protein
VGQFRYILTNLGEKMSDEEVDELLKAVDTSSGELNYMGELFSIYFRETGVLTMLQTWSRRFSQTKRRRLDFLLFLLLSLSRHETKLARILAFNGLHLRGDWEERFCHIRRQKRQKLASGAVWCTGQVRAGRGLLLVYSRALLSFDKCTVSVISRRCWIC